VQWAAPVAETDTSSQPLIIKLTDMCTESGGGPFGQLSLAFSLACMSSLFQQRLVSASILCIKFGLIPPCSNYHTSATSVGSQLDQVSITGQAATEQCMMTFAGHQSYCLALCAYASSCQLVHREPLHTRTPQLNSAAGVSVLST